MHLKNTVKFVEHITNNHVLLESLGPIDGTVYKHGEDDIWVSVWEKGSYDIKITYLGFCRFL